MKHHRARSAAVLTALTLCASALVVASAPGWAAETLLSQGKPATASSIEDATLTADKAVDGNAGTRWASAEGVDPQWIRIDLGAVATVSRIRLNWEAAYAKSYRVEFSSDGSTWATKYTTAAGTAGIKEITTATGEARYVRVYGTQRGTAYGYSLFEVEIYGEGGGTPPGPGPDYQAENATISAGLVESNHAGFTGTGFVNYNNATGSYVQWTVTIATAGRYDLVLRYANGTTVNRPMDIVVDGTVVQSGLSFPGTGAWASWQTATVTRDLTAGSHTVRATATTVNGGPNVDKLTVTTAAPPVQSFTVVAAGDIAEQCTASSSSCIHPKTAARTQAINPDFVITMGDNQYDDARLSDFQNYYNTSWGAFKAKTKPTPGNHESYDPAGFEAGYLSYFGTAARPNGTTWYSYNVGNWHFIALDSNSFDSSAQLNWLTADLAANTKGCIAAYWHHPLYSSGGHGNDPVSAPVWSRLLQSRADLVLNGHDHHYERFGPQNGNGQADPNGIVEIIGGTGGASPYDIENVQPNSQFRLSGKFGVVKLTFTDNTFSWQYIEHSGAVLDTSPVHTCH